MVHHLDETDITMLNKLQEEGRTQRNKIAEMVNLSVPSVSERLRKLEEKKLIEGYHAILNAKAFHLDITAYIFVEVDRSQSYHDFVEQAEKEDEIQEIHSITGDGSHILKIRTKNTGTLERLLSTIQSWNGVKRTRTNIVLSTFKETRKIPIEQGIAF